MQVNWQRYILQLFPILLRKSKILFSLAWALTTYSRNKYDEEYSFILSLIEELRYTSQTFPFLSLLNRKFDPLLRRIYIIDGTEGYISLVKQAEQDSTDITLCGYDDHDNVFLAIPDSENTFGEDFIVCIPSQLDILKIENFIKRYIYCGTSFKIQQI